MYVHIGWFSKQYNILTDQRYVLHKLTKRWFRIQKKNVLQSYYTYL